MSTIVNDRRSLAEQFVDPSALVVPDEDDLEYVELYPAARLLDGALRRLSVVRGAVERQVGRRLLALKRHGGFEKLGFQDQADYMIERTDLSPRSGQELIRVAEKCETLPLLSRALDERVISASQVRLLTRVAKPENEAAWIEKARGLSVRVLADEVRAARKEAREDGGVAAEEDEDAEAMEKTSFAAPDWLQVKWRLAVEMFAKIEGQDGLPEGAAAEAFVAEWQAGAEPIRVEVDEARAEAERKRAEAVKAHRARCKAELDKLRAHLEKETERWSFLEAQLPAVEFADRFAGSDEELSNDIKVLDREIRESGLRHLDALSGRILLTMGRLGLFTKMWFSDLGHYATERPGLSPRKARELKFLERRLFDLPLLQEACFSGELGQAKLRVVVRVADVQTEALWLERAKKVTVRRLEQEVRFADKRRCLLEDGLIAVTPEDRVYGICKPLPPPEGTDIHRETEKLAAVVRNIGARHASAPRGRVSFVAEPEVARLWREALAQCREIHGRSLADWQCADRFLDSFFAEWERKDPYGAVLAHKVIARDGYGCSVPACRSRRGLQAHHVRWRSRGGKDEMGNEATLCHRHHAQGVHEGWIEVTGEAPGNLHWRMGVVNGEALWTVGPGEVISEG